MWASLLGPVSAQAAGAPLALGGLKQRAVFAMLALSPGRVVSLDRLVDELWHEEPPGRATLGLQSYVSRLRRVLAAAGADPDVPRIVTRPPGWLMDVDPQLVDVTRFETLVAQARQEPVEAARPLLDEALSLWRGEPLADLQALPFAREEAARLMELRLAAQELALEAGLAAGDVAAAADAAREFVRANPFRERGWIALMLALYRSGRQSEALAAAAQLRRTLADELGIDPSPQAQAMEQRILRQDPDLTPVPLPGTAAVPRPAPVAGGEGRSDDRPLGRDVALAAVDRAVAAAVGGRGALLALEASAGAGKTTLLRAIADRVTGAGGLVVQGSGVGAGAVPALWPWVTIVRRLAALLPADQAPRPGDAADHALQVMRAGGPTDAPSGSRAQLYRGVVDLLLAARERAPLAVVVDDLQWVDADTLTLLALAVDQLVDHGVVFAVAVRTGEPGTGEALSTLHRVRREALVRLPLPGLGVDDVTEVVRRLGGPASDADLAAVVHERTGGNPFFVGELVRLLVSERRLDPEHVRDALPTEVEEVLRRRLERLPQQTVALLTVVALAGRAVDVDTLAAVTGLDGDAVLDACESGLVAELLVEDGPRFALSHDLVRQTVERGVSAARRVRLHARLADALRARRALTAEDVVAVARHLTLAEPVVGSAAVPFLVAAADDALTRNAHREAERLVEQALDLARRTPEGEEREERARLVTSLRRRLAIARTWGAGVLTDDATSDLLEARPSIAESPSGWVTALISRGLSGHYDEVAAIAEQTLAGELAPAARARAHFVAGWAQFVRGQLDDADRHLRAFEEVDDGSDLGPAVLAGAVDVPAAAYAALVAHGRGDEAAADRADRLARTRAARRAEPTRMEAALYGAWLRAVRGDAEGCRAQAASCASMAARLESPVYAVHARLLIAWADALHGDPEGARRADSAYAESQASGIRLFAPLYLLLCAEAHAATGRQDEAAERVAQAWRVSEELGDVPKAPRLLALADDLVPRPLQASRKP